MKRPIFILAIFCSTTLSALSQKIKPDWKEVKAPFTQEDRQNFITPPRYDYPETWFHFIDGNVEKEGITKDLEAIAGAGISGVQFFHGGNIGGGWPGVKDHIYCLSDKWEDMLHYTASEAKRLGLRFTMQNCPGWSMAGGPWITPEKSMRILTHTRTDVKGGEKIKITLPVNEEHSTRERDYKDLFVLAFPRTSEDIIVPSEVMADTLSGPLLKILSGKKEKITVPSGRTVKMEVRFPADTLIRTLVMNHANQLNYYRCYEPEINIKVEAYTKIGTRYTMLDCPIPAGAWQDPAKTLTLALNEARTSRLLVTIEQQHGISLDCLHFLSGARKNNWEAEAGWDLREIPYQAAVPNQSKEGYIPAEKIIDITDCMAPDGEIEWDAPKGEWAILRIGHCSNLKRNGPAPLEATGLECNKFSKEGADANFAGYIGKYANSAVNGLLSGVLLDSWECITQTWTGNMEEEFKGCTGYALRQWIPAIFGYVIDDQLTTFKFLRDWRYTINHLIVDNFYGRMAENSRKAGLTIQYETSGGDVYPIDIMEYYKYADIPMTEFWYDTTSLEFVGSINFKPVRPAASAGHIYGKTRVSAEAFTSGLRWDQHLWQLREDANRHMAQGVSHLVFHTYTHNPKADSLKPGTSFGTSTGSPFLRGQTWWQFMPSFTKCMARSTYMLERGLPSADVLWYLGDDINHKPNQRPEYMPGYNYDYCNMDVLLNRLEIRDGRIITPEGISYSVLWYPLAKVIAPATLHRLVELVKEGMILVTECPGDVATLMEYDRKQFVEEYRELYGNETIHKLGKGCVYLGTGIVDALHAEGIEEDLISDKVDWMHRKTDGADWYFVAAPEGKGYSGTLDIRNTGRVEIWDPVTGKISEVVTTNEGTRTKIQLNLERSQSLFILFDHTEERSKDLHTSALVSSTDISRGWNVTFPKGWGIESAMKMDTLVAWKDLDTTPEGRSFSGTARYSRKFTINNLTEDRTFILKLGEVDMVAKVTVNDKEFDPVWTYPFETDITTALKKGTNTIEIEVTSGWYNRLVYDAGLDQAMRKTWTIAGPKKGSKMQATGLLGPVVIDCME